MIRFWMFELSERNQRVPDRMRTGTDLERLGELRKIAFTSISSPKI